MQLTPTITFRGVERTAALEGEVLARLDKLETYYPGIMGCRVLVELVQRHHEAGNRTGEHRHSCASTPRPTVFSHGV